MPTLPMIDVKTHANHSPHVVILGAGASRAATLSGDLNGLTLPLMSDFVDVVGLAPLLQSTGLSQGSSNIEAIYQELSETLDLLTVVSEVESHIREYFESIEIPNQANFYDYLLLSLREKDVIATFNWDPLLLQSYKRNVNLKRLPKILFLHGNVAVGICVECRTKGHAHSLCGSCGQPFAQTKLLYPVQQKDYVSDPFIAAEWDELKRLLEYAYIVTVVGYSAPSTDAAAVDLLRGVWDINQTRELAQVEIVDIRPKRELYETWEPFFIRKNYYMTKSIHSTVLARHPRRSCDAFGWASLQVSPWSVNQLPRFRILPKLQDWMQYLILEEQNLEDNGVPFSGKTTAEMEKLYA